MTLKASPLSNQGVRLGVPLVLNTRESHPGGVLEGGDVWSDGALAPSECVQLDTPTVGIRFARTRVLLSGDAFSVYSTFGSTAILLPYF